MNVNPKTLLFVAITLWIFNQLAPGSSLWLLIDIYGGYLILSRRMDGEYLATRTCWVCQMIIELKVIFFPRETFGSGSERCDFGLTGNYYRSLQGLWFSLAAKVGSLLCVFLNCLLTKMKTLRCSETSGTARQMADCRIQKARVFIFPSHSMLHTLWSWFIVN